MPKDMKEITKALGDLTSALREKRITEAQAKEKLEKVTGMYARKSEFSGASGSGQAVDLEKIHKESGGPEEHVEFRKRCDDVYLCSQLLKVDPCSLKTWKELKRTAPSDLRKAMDATIDSNQGADWVPTGFSGELIDRVRLEFKVGALFRRINIPTNPYKIPIVSSDATGYLIAESNVEATEAGRITASTPGTGNVTLNAKKIAARVIFSEELTEDSIVNVSDFVKANIAVALADAAEAAYVSGDTSGTHQDFDVTAATDSRKAWNGLRKLTQAANVVDLSTFSTQKLRQLRQKMGKYGVAPSNLAWVTGTTGSVKFLQLAEVITLDKYGDKATVVTGEIGKFDGSPIIVSEKIREDLNTSGVFDGTDQSKTQVLLVYRPGFVIGDRRMMKIKTGEDIQTDQQIVVATMRLDFEALYAVASNNTIARGDQVSLTI